MGDRHLLAIAVVAAPGCGEAATPLSVGLVLAASMVASLDSSNSQQQQHWNPQLTRRSRRVGHSDCHWSDSIDREGKRLTRCVPVSVSSWTALIGGCDLVRPPVLSETQTTTLVGGSNRLPVHRVSRAAAKEKSLEKNPEQEPGKQQMGNHPD